MSEILSYTSAQLKLAARAVDSAARRLASHPDQPCTEPASKKRKSLVLLEAAPKETDEPQEIRNGSNNNNDASLRTPPPTPTMDQIRVLLQLWKHGMVSGDAKAVAARYSPSAVMIPFDSDVPLLGRDAIQAYYEQILPVYKPKSIKVLHGNVAIPNETTESDCCMAQDNGIYDITSPCGSVVRMRYTFVYVRNSKTGHWGIVHHSSSKICVVDDSPLASTDEYSNSRTVQGRPIDKSNTKSTNDNETNEPASAEPADRCTPPLAAPDRRPSQIDHLVGLLTGTKTITQNDLILLSMSGKPIPVAETTRLELN